MSVLDKFLDAIRLNDDFDDDDEFFDDEDLEALDEKNRNIVSLKNWMTMMMKMKKLNM